MDYERSTDEDSENEENWLDTNWDTEVTSAGLPITKPATSSTDPAFARLRTGAKESSGTDSNDGQGSVPLMTRMQLNDHKAGMQGLDKEHINQIIYEASKGSRFFENERRKEEQVRLRIQEQEKHKRRITEAELQKGKAEADALVAQLEASRDLSQAIVHVDMDAFYAAVEMREDPSLRNKPMAVGGIGMLSTSNYEARKYGVRAAMPGFIGRKLCPQLVIVPTNFPKYHEVSAQVRDIFKQYDPNFCPMSLDEAYLNFTAHVAKRQTLTIQERSFLKRCKSIADLSTCCCDLNDTLRDAVVFGKEFPAGFAVAESPAKNSSEDSHDHVTVPKSPAKSSTDAAHNHEVLKRGAGLSPRKLFKSSLPTRETEVGKMECAPELEESPFPKSSSVSKTETLHTSSTGPESLCTASECKRETLEAHLHLSVSQHASGPECLKHSGPEACCDAESVQNSDFSLKPVGIGCPCYVCGKPVPEYEVVTFGLDVESAVQEMRCRIEQRTCLTASAGIAPNMMLAKVCSDQNKPNGQFYLPPDLDRVRDFVRPLPIRKISGIGRVTEQLLGALGITTCSDLYKQRAWLYHLYSSVSFSYFMRVACGIGSVQVARDEDRKSMSTERTFRELSQPEELYSKCLDLCHNLADDLADEELMGKTISLKLKTTDFQVRTRAQTISNYTNDADTIFAVAKGILRAEIQAELPKPLRLRLMGVRMSKLAHVSECAQEKQNTIKGFLSKMNSPSVAPASPASPVNTKTSSPAGLVHSPVGASQAPSSSHFGMSSSHEASDCVDGDVSHRLSNKEQVDTRGVSSVESKEVVGKRQESLTHSDPLDRVEGAAGVTELSSSDPFAENNKMSTHGENAETTAQIHAAQGSRLQDRNSQNASIGERWEEIIPEKDNISRALDMNDNHKEILVKEQDQSKAQNSKMECTDSIAAISNIDTAVDPAMEILVLTNSENLSESKPSSSKSHRKETTPPCQATGEVKAETLPISVVSASVCHPEAATSSSSSRQTSAVSHSSVQDSNIQRDTASLFVREPSYTCPVCCKEISCINLTDLNAHIDQCLQGGQPQSQQKTSADKTAVGSVPKKSKKAQVQSSKSPLTNKNAQGSSKRPQSASTSTSSQSVSISKHQVSTKRQQGFVGGEERRDGGSDACSPIAPSTQLSGVHFGAECVNRSWCSQNDGTKSHVPKEDENIDNRNKSKVENTGILQGVDYMVCPLCGAERSDWTLESFNQHVDTCLNRDTISQILREQKNQEHGKKRQAGGCPQDQKSSQTASKRAKKSTVSKSEGSILSFFKN